MTEWDDLDLEPDEDHGGPERRAALWQALEGDRVVPDAELLPLLSGLLDDDILRVRTLWMGLTQTVRLALLTTLAELAESDFTMDFSAIFRLALRDADPDVRVAALRGLSEVEDVRLVPELVRMLRQDPSVDARRAAAEGLGKFVLLGELQKLRPDPFHRTVTALCETYRDRDEDPLVRQLALESVAYTGEHSVPQMIETAYAEESAGMRRSAVVAMGRSADARWSQIVQHELLSPDRDMRHGAARACGELQIRQSVRELIGLTDDVDERIQVMALWALGQIGGSQARRALQQVADEGEHALAAAAEEALQELEFFHGDLSSFFGPPESYDGETDEAWQLPDLADLDDDENGEIVQHGYTHAERLADDEVDEDDPDLWDDDNDEDYDDRDIFDIVNEDDEDDEEEWD
jgi:HEAT repeat protein